MWKFPSPATCITELRHSAPPSSVWLIPVIKSKTLTPLPTSPQLIKKQYVNADWHARAIPLGTHTSKQRSICRLQLSIIPLLITFNEPIACCSYQYVRLNRCHKSLCSRILWRGQIMRHYLYVALGDSFGEHKFMEDQTSILFLWYKNALLLLLYRFP